MKFCFVKKQKQITKNDNFYVRVMAMIKCNGKWHRHKGWSLAILEDDHRRGRSLSHLVGNFLIFLNSQKKDDK